MTNYDLEERTASFGEAVIRFCKKLPQTAITKPIIVQLIRAATSVGSNYCEADDAESRRDFMHKIGITKKETRETKHWLRMMIVALPDTEEEAGKLWNEAKELNLIFNAIIHKSRSNDLIQKTSH